VAFGDFHLQAATGQDRPPAQKQQILDQARKAYQQALKLDPKCIAAYRGLARTYQQLGDHDRTVATYQSALKVLPGEASLWFELGMCQARGKEWGPALDNLKKATELEPENRTYSDMRAYSLARAGRYQESFECFKKTVGEGQAHYNLARMLVHVKENEAAKEHLRLALKADPNLSAARQMLVKLEPTKTSPVVTVGFEEVRDPSR
jgi:tetratricopeptide (TPR) repeat protein